MLAIEEQLWWVDRNAPLSEFEQYVLVLEDRRFFLHNGVDWKAVLREAYKFLFTDRYGGASTIDMQLFRTVSNRYERTLRRKLREFVGVYLLQRKFSKLEILRAYLSSAYFGTGLRGAEMGAMALFPDLYPDELNVDLGLLEGAQAGELASLLVYPKPRVASPDWRAKVRRRADYGTAVLPVGKKKFQQIKG